MNRLGGLHELPEDKKDFKLGFVFQLPKLEELPEEFEIEPYDILDQGGNDFCSAYTRAGMKAVMEDKMPFAPALFAISKEISGDLLEWGQDMRSAFKASVKSVPLYENAPERLKKALREQDWVYLRDISNYQKEYIESGKKYADGSYFSVVSPFHDEFDTAKLALWKFRKKKQTIAIGVIFSWTLDTVKLTGIHDRGYGHMMYLTGFCTISDEDDKLVKESKMTMEEAIKRYKNGISK